jgi:hypothetical protein
MNKLDFSVIALALAFACNTGVPGLYRQPDGRQRDIATITTKNHVISAAVTAMWLGLGGCAGMSAQEKNTAVGVGFDGVIGHEVSKHEGCLT